MILKYAFAFLVVAFTAFQNANARFHEVVLQGINGAFSFSEETSMDIEGNYLYFLTPQWQLLGGFEYEKNGDVFTQTGITFGSAFNFGAINHNQKFYIKPQITFASVEIGGDSESTTFLSGQFGKRIPIFAGTYKLNYTPSIGVSFPLSNSDNFDTVISINILALSLVF